MSVRSHKTAARGGCLVKSTRRARRRFEPGTVPTGSGLNAYEASSPAAPARAETPPLDPGTIATAVAAVAPTLPPEHRRSLATVFRALAEALETE
jgi:hypothetical protein